MQNFNSLGCLVLEISAVQCEACHGFGAEASVHKLFVGGVIALTEIGSRNIDVVKHLFENYEFHYMVPSNNLYGGVGIYFSKNVRNLEILDISIKIYCYCAKCEIESLFATFCYGGEIYTLCGIYKHPNGNTRHFVEDLEIPLNIVGPHSTTIVTGDINIDIIN